MLKRFISVLMLFAVYFAAKGGGREGGSGQDCARSQFSRRCFTTRVPSELRQLLLSVPKDTFLGAWWPCSTPFLWIETIFSDREWLFKSMSRGSSSHNTGGWESGPDLKRRLRCSACRGYGHSAGHSECPEMTHFQSSSSFK